MNPKRTMVINGLAEALLTTPEWLTGLSDDKEYDTYTLCQRDIEEHIKKYLDTVSHTVKGEPRQQLLTTFLGKMVDLYTVMTYYLLTLWRKLTVWRRTRAERVSWTVRHRVRGNHGAGIPQEDGSTD